MLDTFATLILLIASFLAFVGCSRPKDRNFKIWLKSLVKSFGSIRRRNDHIRAAIILRLFDRKVQNGVKSFISLSVTRVKSLNAVGSKGELIAFCIMFGPFLYLMILGSNYNSLIFMFSTLWFLAFISYMIVFFHIMDSEIKPITIQDSVHTYSEITGRTKILSILLMPVGIIFGLRYKFLLTNEDRIATCVRYDERQFVIALVVSSFAIFALVHKLFYNYLDLSPFVFYPLTLTLGPVFFLFVAILILFAFMLPTMTKGKEGPDFKKLSRGALYLSVTTTITLLLYYTSKYETPRIFDTGSVWLVYVNIICDIYVIYLFNRLASFIAITRNQSNQFSIIIVREYILFMIRSLIASAISMYIGFFFSETPLTVYGATRLLFGLNPFESGAYLGVVFWLVHTAVVPAVAILTIPVVLISYRIWRVFLHRIIIGAVRNGSPLVYISCSLVFFATSLQLVLELF